MTVNAITDTKKGRTGIAPTYLHTTQIYAYHNERVTVVMQIYDFLYHVVLLYIFLLFMLFIQLCCRHTFPQRSYTIRSYILLSFYISE